MNREFRNQFCHVYSLKNINMESPYYIIAVLSWYNSWAAFIDKNYGSFPLFVVDMNNFDQNYETYVKIYKICKEVNKKLPMESSEQCTIS